MIEILPCTNEAEERCSLDVYNAVWPHDAVTMDEVRSFKSSARDHIDCIASIDGAVVGSAVGVIFPQRVHRVFTIVTSLPSSVGAASAPRSTARSPPGRRSAA